ncbi:MAG TPA: hypothetical protein VFE53_13840 [Mucilaginibacter sp.]|jgi:uncharacterized radical SAM superfamily Fe-S cluster-containing enzyme|nr:hypothetical protein [Mucilaginibacter sp.]
MKTLEKPVQNKNLSGEVKKSKQSKLTLEIGEAIKEVKQMQDGLIQPLSLKDI